MRIFTILLIVLFAAGFINFVRDGQTFHIAQVLPFAGGGTAGLYDYTAIALLGLALWGIPDSIETRNRSDHPTEFAPSLSGSAQRPWDITRT